MGWTQLGHCKMMKMFDSFRFPDKRQASVFDTGFHSEMAPEAFMYAVPLAWYREHHVRKFVVH